MSVSASSRQSGSERLVDVQIGNRPGGRCRILWEGGVETQGHANGRNVTEAPSCMPTLGHRRQVGEYLGLSKPLVLQGRASLS